MKRRTDMRERDDAVSPVIGVMLMLVVTLIIAAVVSGFAGGMITSQEATPSANFDVSMTDKSIGLTVRSISEEVSSKDITIVLSKAGEMRKLVPGASTVPFGFNIVEWKDVKGFHDNENVTNAALDPEISTTSAANITNSAQWFGNYTLKTGSRMSASHNAFKDVAGIPLPDGFSKPTYTKSEFYDLTAELWQSVFADTVTDTPLGSDSHVLKIRSGTEITDPSLAQYLDGKGFIQLEGSKNITNTQLWAEATDHEWSFGQTIMYHDGYGGISVAPGDRVTVTIVYLPSGQTMFTKTVTVKEA
jgi:FlaG/FlaF family flagellin (archaellin)